MAVLTQTSAPLRINLHRKLLSFPSLIVAVLMTCVFLLVPRSVADPDIWWHLRNAQYQIQSHTFIRHDMYSFTTPGAAWMDHEWLAELPFYLGWHLLGSRGLFLVVALAVECIFLGVFYLAYKHSHNIKAALIVSLIAAFLSTVSFGPRTLLFGWIALIAELVILEAFLGRRSGADRRTLILLPVLFGVWVNTHGSWLIGMVVLIAFALSGCLRIQVGAIENDSWTRAQVRTLAAALALSTAALFVNPYGWRLVIYPFDLAFRQKLNIANIEEWASLDFHSPRGHALLLSLTLVFFAQLFWRRKWALYELAFLLVGVYAAFTYSRFLFLAAILIFPLIAKDIPWLSPYREERDKPWLNAAMLLILCLLVVHHVSGLVQAESGSGREFPDQALPLLETFQPQGNVLNDFLWGGYLEWHAPQIPVMIDSRVDIFEYGGVLKDYLDIVRMKNTLDLLNKYKIRYVLFEQDAPLTYLLKQTHQWKVDYQDGTTILLERVEQAPSSRANLPTYSHHG